MRRANARQRVGRDEGGATGGELALVLRGMAPVQLVADDDGDHRVAEELQPLVGRQARIGVLVEVAGVDERLAEARGVGEGEAE